MSSKQNVMAIFIAILTLLFFSCGEEIPEEPTPETGEKSFTNTIGMKFVYIPSGTFQMGSPEDEPGRYSNEKQHSVMMTKGLFVQVTEVTQGQWEKLMGNNPSESKECGENCPVNMVSWVDVQEFLKKLNAKEKTNKYRLPTEAEWEYAARAGANTMFCFGDNERRLGEFAWYFRNSADAIQPVAQLRPNAWGLYDVHGNVWEWAQDYPSVYPSATLIDPPGSISGTVRVFRGGACTSFPERVRLAFRHSFPPTLKSHILGFRVVREP